MGSSPYLPNTFIVLSLLRRILQVPPIGEKVISQRLRWFAHLQRRYSNHPCRKVQQMKVDRKSRRGRPEKELEAVRRRRHEDQRRHNRGCARQKELSENDSNCGPHNSSDTTQLNGEEEEEGSLCSACIAINNFLCLLSAEYKV